MEELSERQRQKQRQINLTKQAINTEQLKKELSTEDLRFSRYRAF